MITQKRRESFTCAVLLRICGLLSLTVSLYLVGEHYGRGPSICGGGEEVLGGIKASCTLVNHSKYSSLLGIPVSILGVTWNIVLLLIGREISKGSLSGLGLHLPTSGGSSTSSSSSTTSSSGSSQVAVASSTTAHSQKYHHLYQEQFIVFQLAWCLLGLLFVFYFMFAEFMVGAICPMCTVVHILVIIQLGCAWRTYSLSNLELLSEIDGPAWWWRLLFRSKVIQEWLGWILGFHLLLLIGFTILPDVLSAPVDEKLAQCIASRPDVWMFGLSACSVCKRQKAMFKDRSWDKYIMGEELEGSSPRYIECGDKVGTGAKLCEQMKINAYPTWIKFAPQDDGSFKIDQHRVLERKEGLQLALDLRTFTNCFE